MQERDPIIGNETDRTHEMAGLDSFVVLATGIS
jgi:hypothetical protein